MAINDPHIPDEKSPQENGHSENSLPSNETIADLQGSESAVAEILKTESSEIQFLDKRSLQQPEPESSTASDSKAQSLNFLKQLSFLAVLFVGFSFLIYFQVFRTKPIQSSPINLARFESQEVRNAVNEIDYEFEMHWESKGISVAEPASWYLQVRRVGLALCGAPPSLEHLRWLENFDEDHRVARYTSHLLSTKACADYLAERFARPWLGTHNGSLIVYRGRRFRYWLSEQLQKNRPYNEVIHAMLTASGSWNNNPAVNFYTAQCDQDQDNKIDQVRLTGRVTRNFMAMRLDCLQCHDDFMGTTRVGPEEEELEGTQIDFHHIAAFFSKTNVTLLGVQEPKSGSDYQYQLLGQEKPETISPKVPFPIASTDPITKTTNAEGSTKTETIDSVTSESRRTHFANWLTSKNNRPFARSIVNRVWGLMFGKPLHSPVDDIPLYGPYPPAMEKLTDQFIESNFDLHQLISVIVQTKVFQSKSVADFQITEDHEEAWACFPMTKIRPEQMSGTVYQSAVLTRTDETSSTLTQLVRYGEQNDFLKRFGDLGDYEFGQSNQTVSQRLLLFNGEMIQKRLAAADALFGSYQTTANLAKDRRTLIETIFLLVLTRKPTEEEASYFVDSLPEENSKAAEDLAWVLTNCNEALWNH